MSLASIVAVLGMLLPAVLPLSYIDRDDVPEPPAVKIERSVNTYSVEGSVNRTVAPVTTPEGFTLTIGSDVLFAYASAIVEDAAQTALSAQLSQIPAGVQVAIEGHTDSRGGDPVNVPLSAARAEAVASVLRTNRPDLILEVTGKGSSEPVASESSEQSMALNRRVELSWMS